MLPAIFLRPAAFLWLWVLPIGLLLMLNLQGYWLIEGNMDPAQRDKALLLGVGVLANLLLGFVYLGFSGKLDAMAGPAPVRFLVGNLGVIASQAAYLWLVISQVDTVLPASVTAWIYPPERFLFNQFAFAMLPLFAGILRVAGSRPVTGAGRAIGLNVGLAVAAPVSLYFLFRIVAALSAGRSIEGIFLATGLIVLGVLMFVAILRALLLGLHRAKGWSDDAVRGAIVLFALVLPLGGLMLNRDIPFPVDFQAWEVYALVVANTAILLVASYQHVRRPRMSFCLLCATFPFSLYFFIVFLPYTPLSILAVIVLGVGFLVLSPIFLFTLHLYLLHQARSNPLFVGDRWRLTLAGVLCTLLLPAFFTVRGLADKAALNAALDYVYTPAVHGGETKYPSSLVNLRRALSSHRSYKNGLYYPLLSDYYSWLVFDNLVLPDDKLAKIESVFFGTTGSSVDRDPLRNRETFWGRRNVRDRARMPRAVPVPRTVEVSRLDVLTKAAGEGQSVVTLSLRLENTGGRAAEYQKMLPLPAGVFVTGFRLQIGGRAVPGRIFEKKTALWVYTMIRDSERRDPGLLLYNRPDELELRVFPVNPGQPSVVEIDFLIPAELAAGSLSAPGSRDPAEVLTRLKDLVPPQLTPDLRGNTLATGLAALALPAVEREPYLHLIVDRSRDNGFTGDLPAAIRQLREKYPTARQVRATLANHDVVDLVPRLTPFDALPATDARELERALPLSGGLSLDLALAHAIRLHDEADLEQVAGAAGIPPRPVFVLLSRKAAPRTLDLKLAEAWADLLPGLEILELDVEGHLATLRSGDGSARPVLRLGHSVRSLPVSVAVGFKNVRRNEALEYWAPEAAGWRPAAGVARAAEPTAWSAAVRLQLQQRDFTRSPGDAGMDLKSLVKASRESGVLVGATSYIVVENSAQWRMLELGERQKLGQNAALDFLETPAPPACWVVAGFAAWLGLRHARRLFRERRLRV